jgi:hypothetical protein
MENIRKASWWIGTILKGLTVLFLLFDAIMKIIKHPQAVEGTKQLGLPEDCLVVLGLYLFIATLLYLYNKTAILGGLLITAYLGGAVAIMYAAQKEGHPYIFPIVFAVLMWGAEFLRNEKMRTVLPLTK